MAIHMYIICVSHRMTSHKWVIPKALPVLVAHPCPRRVTLCRRCCLCYSLFKNINCLCIRQYYWAHHLVVDCWMVFCPVIRQIVFAWAPMIMKLFLTLTIFQPIEAHVHCLRCFGLNFVVYYSICCGVISLDWCERLCDARALREFCALGLLFLHS